MYQFNDQTIDFVWRFILHVITGFLSVIVHYGIMALLLKAGYAAVIASSGGFVFGALTRFFTAYFHVFSPQGSVTQTLPKFLLSLMLQAVLNFLLLQGFIELTIPVWWSQILTTLTLTIVNYIIYRIWVFI